MPSSVTNFFLTEVKVLRYYRTCNSVTVETRILLKLDSKCKRFAIKTQKFCTSLLPQRILFAIKVLKFRINLCCHQLPSFPVTEVKVLRYYRTRNSVAIETQILLKFAFKTQTVCNKNTEILHKFATTTHTFCNQST